MLQILGGGREEQVDLTLALVLADRDASGKTNRKKQEAAASVGAPQVTREGRCCTERPYGAYTAITITGD